MSTQTSVHTQLSQGHFIEDEHGLGWAYEDLVVRCDLSDMKQRLRIASLSKELLVRAAKLKNARLNRNAAGKQSALRAIDATAGFAEDALLLAASGYEVTLIERNAIIFALLQDGLERARSDATLSAFIGRMSLIQGDSVDILPTLQEKPDLIYLDPMFPAKQKTARAKKKLFVFHQLEEPCEDEEVLMEAARLCEPQRIVIKRPLKGPAFAHQKPSHSLEGKLIRYDCYELS